MPAQGAPPSERRRAPVPVWKGTDHDRLPCGPSCSRPGPPRPTAAARGPSGGPGARPPPAPLRFGVGARVTAAVMTDDYARVLVGILSRLDQTGLVRETGDVSTYLGGHEA